MSVLAESLKTRPAADPTWRPEAKAADLEAARDSDRPVATRELLARCKRAAADVIPRATVQEREDLSADLAEWIARHCETWNPPRRLVRRSYLRWKAADLADSRTGWRDQANRRETVGLPAVDPDGSILAQADPTEPGPVDADAEWLVDALELDPDMSAAVVAILSGYGSALELAAGLGISHQAAMKRVSRGRAKLREAFPNPTALRKALADLDATLRERAYNPDRPHLEAAARTARDLLEAIAPTTGRRPTGTLEREPRTPKAPDHWSDRRRKSLAARPDFSAGLPVSSPRARTGRRFAWTPAGLALVGSPEEEAAVQAAGLVRLEARAAGRAAASKAPTRAAAVVGYVSAAMSECEAPTP